MNDKILISSVLTDLTLASKTKFIEAKDNEDLIELAKTKGIDLPSPDLACFETYYCELDKPNLNNAMLTKKAAEEGINSLVGKQINLNHQGKNYVIGYTIDAKIKDDLVVVTGILFKSLFSEEFDEIKQLFEEGNLFVSFELWNKEPETGNSIIEMMDNGIKKITKMIAHGVGLLLRGVKPACKKAQVFKLLANQKDSEEQIFQEDDRFAYASFTNEVVDCTHCDNCTREKEEKIMVKCEKCGKEFETSAEEKICVECTSLLKEEPKAQSSEETKIDETPVETKTEISETQITEKKEEENSVVETKTEVVAEVKPEETPKAEEKAEEKKEEVVAEEKARTITTTQEVTKVEEIKPEGEVITTEVKTESTVVDDEGKEKQKVVEENKTVVTYTYEQVQEAINASIEELVAALPKEVTDRIKELIKDGKSAKEAMKQAWEEYKKSQEKALEEKDNEIIKTQEELGKKNQEIEAIKIEKAAQTKKDEQPSLTVGSTEPTYDELLEIKKKINKNAFGHDKL